MSSPARINVFNDAKVAYRSAIKSAEISWRFACFAWASSQSSHVNLPA